MAIVSKEIMNLRSFISIVLMNSLFFSAGYAGTLSLSTPYKEVMPIQTESIVMVDGQAGGVKVVAEGAFFRSETGEPDIPWQQVTVLLAPNTNPDSISVRLEKPQYRAIDGIWDIEPAAPMGTWDEDGTPIIVWPEGKVFEDGRDMSVYDSNAFWPFDAVRRIHTGQLHQWQLAEIAVPLVRYNPVTGELKELVSATVVIDYARRKGKKAETMLKLKGGNHGRQGRQRVRDIAVNFTAAASEYDAASEDEVQTDAVLVPAADTTQEGDIGIAGVNSKGYLILTTNTIVNTSTVLANFVAHKQSRGWNVMVRTETDWGGGTGPTGAANIRTWLRANYVSLDILYVLLIGNPNPDSGDVPMRWYDDGRGSAPTDALYWDLSSTSGWDKYWEVVVGRIPSYGTISILDAILQKTINYENSQKVLWRRNALLPMVPLDETTPAYQCGEQIKNLCLAPNSIASTRIYDETYGLSPAPEYLLSNRYPATEWGSQPYGLVVWLTHGNQTLADNIIDTSNIYRLNDNYPSVVYEGSCQNAWPENSANLAFRLLQRGAITTVGATRDSFYNIGQTNYTVEGSIGSLAYRYSRNLTVNRQSCGLALSNAKQQNYIYTPNATRMTLLGDPSIVFFVEPDTTPPSPDPMVWEVEPYEGGFGIITMSAATAIDNAVSDVEYYFECVSGGGHDSGWQSSPVYIDSYVTELVNSYRVKARDVSDYNNETRYSAESTVTIAPYPYEGKVRTLPGKIEAEFFDVGGQGITYFDTTSGNAGGQSRTSENVDIVNITDGGTGYAIDTIENGEWLTYTVNSAAVQTDFYVRVASSQAGGQILVWLDEELLTTFNVPDTGGKDSYQTLLSAGIILPEKTNAILKLEFIGSGFCLNWIAFQTQLPYPGAPLEIPGRIEFEDYDIGGQDISYSDVTSQNAYGYYRPDESVDILSVTDNNAGFGVYVTAAEWLEYTCNVAVAGFYKIVVRHTSNFTAQELTLTINGEIRAVFELAKTNGWNNWQSTVVQDVYLDSGEQVLRFTLTKSTGLLNYAEFDRHYNAADISKGGLVDANDFAILSAQWLGVPGTPSADIAPAGGDGIVDMLDLLVLIENWLVSE